jgi:hypothetical protein
VRISAGLNGNVKRLREVKTSSINWRFTKKPSLKGGFFIANSNGYQHARAVAGPSALAVVHGICQMMAKSQPDNDSPTVTQYPTGRLRLANQKTLAALA